MKQIIDTKEYLKYKGQFPTNGAVFVAMLIDLFTFHIGIFLFLKLYGLVAQSVFDKYTIGRIGFFIYCISLLLIPVLSAKAQTLGQFITKIKIQAVSGESLAIHKAVIRWVYSIISPVGYSQKPVPWYDLKTGAVLIKRDQK